MGRSSRSVGLMILCSILLTAVATSPTDGDTPKVKTARRHLMSRRPAPGPPLTSMLETKPFPADVKTAVDKINGGTDPLDVDKLQTGMTSLKAALAANAHLKGTDDSNIAYVKQWEATLKYLNEDFKKAAKGSVDTFVAGLQTLQNATAPATAPGPPGPTPEQLYETAKGKVVGPSGVDLSNTNEVTLEGLIDAADAAYQPLGRSTNDPDLDPARAKLHEFRQGTYATEKGNIPADAALDASTLADLEPVMQKVVTAYKKLNGPASNPADDAELTDAIAKLRALGSTIL